MGMGHDTMSVTTTNHNNHTFTHIRTVTSTSTRGRIILVRARQRRAATPRQHVILLAFLVLLALASLSAHTPCVVHAQPAADATIPNVNGADSLAQGRQLFQSGQYEEAASYFWRAVLLHGEQTEPPSSATHYTVEDAFGLFLQC